VNPDHDGTPGIIQAGGPDIEKQTILALGFILSFSARDRGHRGLRSDSAKLQGRSNAIPGKGGLRGHPAERANGRSSIGYSFEYIKAILKTTLNLTGTGIDDTVC